MQECTTHAHRMQYLTFSALLRPLKGVPSKYQVLDCVPQTCLVDINLW